MADQHTGQDPGHLTFLDKKPSWESGGRREGQTGWCCLPIHLVHSPRGQKKCLSKYPVLSGAGIIPSPDPHRLTSILGFQGAISDEHHREHILAQVGRANTTSLDPEAQRSSANAARWALGTALDLERRSGWNPGLDILLLMTLNKLPNPEPPLFHP